VTPPTGRGVSSWGPFRQVISAARTKPLVQIYETTDEGRRLAEDFYALVKSSRKPGMGPMVGVGAAAGRAVVSAGVSTGVGIASELSAR
jgi:hypothetical protein